MPAGRYAVSGAELSHAVDIAAPMADGEFGGSVRRMSEVLSCVTCHGANDLRRCTLGIAVHASHRGS